MFAKLQPMLKRPSSTYMSLCHLLSRCMGMVVLTAVVVLAGATPAWAQLAPFQGVDSLITTNVPAVAEPFPDAPYATPCDGGSFAGCAGSTTDLTFGTGVNRILEAVEIAGNRFEPATALFPGVQPVDIQFRRRLDVPNVPAAREILFYEQTTATADTLNLGPSQVGSIEEAMLNNVINRGIDNVFNNATAGGQETRNNIQRIDYLLTGGLDINDPGIANPDDVGFLILERGGNDNFRIAAVTGFDPVTGLPTAYGPLVRATANDWGTSNSVTIPTAVLRNDGPSIPDFLPSHLVGAQPIRGIFFPLSSLVDVSTFTGQIFGYSLFADDITDAVNLVAFENFPITTNGTTQGGLDLVAGGFGLIQQVPAGDLTLAKRITNVTGPAQVPNFNQVVGTGAAITALNNAGLGQGLINANIPGLQPGHEVEYTLYFVNTGGEDVTNVAICDRIPVDTSFARVDPGVTPTAPTGNYTPGAFGTFTSNDPLPGLCGPGDTADNLRGAVEANVGTVGPGQVGFVRFTVTVD